MRRLRNSNPGKKKSGPKLRASGDASFRQKANKAFKSFRENPHHMPISELGYCFVKTGLGVLQVDVGWLLILVGGILQRSKQKSGEVEEIELTEDVLDASVEVLRAIPRYVDADEPGMFFEADFFVRTKSLERGKIPFDNPFTIGQVFQLMLAKGEKREIINLKFLGSLLAGWPHALLLPEVAEAFMTTISEQGQVGTKAWGKFLDKHFHQARRRGRRREALYDSLFKKRLEDPTLSYGKLALEVSRVRKIDLNTAREQLKAAIAYRRRKAAKVM